MLQGLGEQNGQVICEFALLDGFRVDLLHLNVAHSLSLSLLYAAHVGFDLLLLLLPVCRWLRAMSTSSSSFTSRKTLAYCSLLVPGDHVLTMTIMSPTSYY